MKKFRRGFTLLEVLIVVAILGIVITAIGACMAAGMRVWDAVRRYSKGEPQLFLACAMMERDLVNAFYFYTVPFSGTVDGVSMPALVRASEVSGEGASGAGVRHIASVRYFWMKDREVLVRKEWVYPSPEPPDSGAEDVAASVVRAEWHYASSSDAPGVWRDSWGDPSNMPQRIKFDAELSGDSGGYRIERVIVRSVTNGVAG